MNFLDNLQIQRRQFVKEFPDFLQVLHKDNQSVHNNRNNVGYDPEIRYAIDINDVQSSQNQAQDFQLIFHPKTQCQTIMARTNYNQKDRILNYKQFAHYLDQIQDQKDAEDLILSYSSILQNQSRFESQIQSLIRCQIPSLQNKFAQGVFYQRHGLFQQAYDSVLSHLKFTLFEIKLGAKNLVNNFELSQNIKKYFEKLLSICSKEYMQEKKTKCFINLLQHGQVFIQFCQNDYNIQQLDEIMSQFLQALILDMIRTIDGQKIMETLFVRAQIQLQSDVAEFFLLQLLRKQKFHKYFCGSALKCFMTNIKRNIASQLKSNRKGFSVKNNCCFCSQPLLEQCGINVYGCGHKFHQFCDHAQLFCSECSYVSDDFVFQKIIFKSENSDRYAVKKSNRKTLKKNNQYRMIRNSQFDQKQQKIYQMKRKLKMFDYEIYQQQKIVLNLTQTNELSAWF